MIFQLLFDRVHFSQRESPYLPQFHWPLWTVQDENYFLLFASNYIREHVQAGDPGYRS